MKNNILIFWATVFAVTVFSVTAVETASADAAPSAKTQEVTYGFNSMPSRATTTCVHHFNKNFEWQDISPADVKDRWNFKIRHKDNPSQILDVTGLLEYKRTIKNADYYFYGVPLENKGNLVRFAHEGAYIRKLKFPIFNFMFFDVELDPEILYLRFPMKIGDEWKVESYGTVKFFAFFKISRKMTVKFKLDAVYDVPMNGRIFHVFKTVSVIDRGDGKTSRQEAWFGAGVGLMYSDTEAYALELQSFEPGPASIKNYELYSIPVQGDGK